MKKELIVLKDPKSPISEIFRTLRTNIQFMDTKKNSKVILVTSAYANEGKSWISSNLAVTFAQAGKKVLLIDADMRKGRQYSIFKISPKPGLSNYLSGINENDEASQNLTSYIQRTHVENLYIIPAGSVPPNPSELLISPQMINLLEELKQICDMIIIDGTPSQLVADSLILTRMADSTIIVTAHEETKKEGLKRVITNIQNVGGKIAGVVLNKMPIMAKEYEQAYYYNAERQNKEFDRKREKISSIDYENRQVNSILNNNIPKEKDINAKKEEASYDVLKQINEYLENEKKKS